MTLFSITAEIQYYLFESELSKKWITTYRFVDWMLTDSDEFSGTHELFVWGGRDLLGLVPIPEWYRMDRDWFNPVYNTYMFMLICWRLVFVAPMGFWTEGMLVSSQLLLTPSVTHRSRDVLPEGTLLVPPFLFSVQALSRANPFSFFLVSKYHNLLSNGAWHPTSREVCSVTAWSV